MYVACATDWRIFKMHYDSMKQLELFQGLKLNEIKEVYECFGGEVKHYNKGQAVIREGDTVKRVGAVIAGQARVIKTDASGKTFIVTTVSEGGYIGVLLAGSGGTGKYSPVTVEAIERLTVVFLPFCKLVRQCKNNCGAHSRIILNFIEGISEKALLLHDRNDCLIKPTVRDKVMSYLARQSQAAETAGGMFEIPLDREGLADYLNVERTALSRELSRMKKDGIIDFNKSIFKILAY